MTDFLLDFNTFRGQTLSGDDRGVVTSNGSIAKSVNSGVGLPVNGPGITMTGTSALLNMGVIASDTAAGVLMQSGTVRVVNTGFLFGETDGINGAASGMIENSGTITSAAGTGRDGIDLSGGRVTLINSGTISSVQARGVFLGGSGPNSIQNTGIITTGGTTAIEFGSGTDRLANSGSITGNVIFGSGTANLINTGLITGNITFGSGAWRLVNSGMIDGNLSANASTGGLFDLRAGVVTGTVTGGGGADRMLGGLGDDRFVGGGGSDTLNGGGGDDVLSGNASDDRLQGGDGDDTLNGEDGNDTLGGGDGSDSLSGAAGNDRANGGDGDDVVIGGDGNDDLRGGTGDDTLRGDAGDNSIDGGDGNDVLSATTGSDTLTGLAGDDTLFGGAGSDLLLGGSGDDEVFGGAGDDTMVGGSGKDTFVFQAGDSTAAAPDTILDFASRTDVIDLGPASAGVLVYRGTAALSGGGVASVNYAVAAGVATVAVDLDGNGVAEMRIVLTGVTSLIAADFLL